MKKISISILFLLISITLFAQIAPETRLPLHVEGNWIKNSNNENVTLRGISLSDIDLLNRPGARNKTIFEIVDILQQENWTGTDVIRLPIHPYEDDWQVGPIGWDTYSDKNVFFNDVLNPIVNYLIERGYYVIIDWHYVNASWSDSGVAANTYDFWNFVADKYANHANVLFELFNEPGGGSWNSWQAKAQEWVNLIRNTHDADNIIISGGPSWSQVLPTSSSDNFFTGGNIAYACHIYPAHSQGGIPNWIEYTVQHAPVIMTEWGYENNSDANVTVGTTTSFGWPYRDYIENYPNVGWTAWCWDHLYRSIMFDKDWVLTGNGETTTESRTWCYPSEGCIVHGSAVDTYENYMGQFTKEWLAFHGGTPGPTFEPTPETTPGPTAEPTPEITGAPIPGTIEAEDYDTMSGIQTETTTDTGGGLNVGYIDTGDYIEFTVTVASTALYSIEYRVASLNGSSGFNLLLDSSLIDSQAVPNTGGWQNWTTITGSAELDAGTSTLRIEAVGSLWNINWFSFTGNGVTSAPTAEPTPGPTGEPTTEPTSGPTAEPTSQPTTTPTTGPTSEPTPDPTDEPTGDWTPITPNFTKDGAGEFFWVTDSMGNYINSWNLNLLEVNGVDYTNTWASAGSISPESDGKYYIHYTSSVAWGHFELKN